MTILLWDGVNMISDRQVTYDGGLITSTRKLFMMRTNEDEIHPAVDFYFMQLGGVVYQHDMAHWGVRRFGGNPPMNSGTSVYVFRTQDALSLFRPGLLMIDEDQPMTMILIGTDLVLEPVSSTPVAYGSGAIQADNFLRMGADMNEAIQALHEVRAPTIGYGWDKFNTLTKERVSVKYETQHGAMERKRDKVPATRFCPRHLR